MRDVRAFALLACLLIACEKSADRPTPPGHCDPSATADADISAAGPFHVGYRALPVTYQPPGGEGPRTIVVNVWYPTRDTDGEAATYIDLVPDDLSWVNATPAPPLSGCGYPTIAFSHGDRAYGGSSSYMMRHFASHGWVAIAPDHTTNTLADTDSTHPHPTKLYIERPSDVSAALDAVGALKSPDPLANKVALDKVLLVGHSFGCYTVWSVAGAAYDRAQIDRNGCDGTDDTPEDCTDAQKNVFDQGFRDTRVVAAITEAASLRRGWFGDTGETAVHIPFLMLTGTGDNGGSEDVTPDWPGLRVADLSWANIAGACHESFNLGHVCDSTLDTEVGYRILRTYQLAFARYHVLGDRSATVSGIVNDTTQVSDLVTFTRK